MHCSSAVVVYVVDIDGGIYAYEFDWVGYIAPQNSQVYDECQIQSGKLLALPREKAYQVFQGKDNTQVLIGISGLLLTSQSETRL